MAACAVAAARRLRQIHRHRPQMRQRTRLQMPPTRRRTGDFVIGQGRRDDSADGIVVVGSDGGALGNVQRGRRCAAAADDDADADTDDIVC